MVEGVRHSGLEKKTWRHNDVADLERLLAAAATERPKLIVFESLYSMDGDVAPIRRICDLAERYDAMTYCDVGDLTVVDLDLVVGVRWHRRCPDHSQDARNIQDPRLSWNKTPHSYPLREAPCHSPSRLPERPGRFLSWN